jgi:hypothetical protein
MRWKFWRKPAQMQGGSGSTPNLTRAKDLPTVVGRDLVVLKKLDPDWVWSLRCVEKSVEGSKDKRIFRVFSPNNAIDSGLKIGNYNSLENHPELIIFSGWYNRRSGRVEFNKENR